MKRPNLRRFLLIISIALVLGSVFAIHKVYNVSAVGDTDTKTAIKELQAEIEKKREKIKQIEQSITEYKDKIQQKRVEAVSLSNQMALLDNRVVQVELDIDATETTIEKLELEIQQLALEIDQKEEDIARQKTILSELIHTLYLEDDKSFVEILATFDTFSGFYDRLQYLQGVEKKLGDSAKTLRLAKESLEYNKLQSEEKQESYEELKVALDNKKKDLEEQLFQKESLLAQTHASELTFNTLVANLRKQYSAIEGEIQSVERSIRQKYQELDKIDETAPPDNTALLTWPATSRYITAYFHDPSYPYRHVFEHSGIDIRASQGTPIKAAASGYVARARRCSSAACYSYIMIVHSGGISTVYGHMSSIAVSEDQFVGRGEVIGYSGGTPGTAGAGPFVTGPHLHFEVRKNGIPVNPMGYFAL